MTLVLAGVVSIRGNDGGVAVDWSGAGSGDLLKIDVLLCAGTSLLLNRGDGACFPDVFPGCDTFNDEDAVLPRNGFEKPGESVGSDA